MFLLARDVAPARDDVPAPVRTTAHCADPPRTRPPSCCCARGAPKLGRRSALVVVLLAGLVLLASCARAAEPGTFISGLNQPRGMAFDAAGNLFVAEAGALRPEDIGRSSPATNHSSRVRRIDGDRAVTTVVDGLPFTDYAASGGIGAADVVVLDRSLYVLTGEGYDDELSRAVLQVGPGASPEPIADIWDFVMDTTPIEQQVSAGGVPVNPYAMVAAPDGGALYVADAASGRVFRVTLAGDISVFVELPKLPPLTGLAFGPDGRLYVAMFSALPHAPGSGAVWAAATSGELTLAAAELTMPIDVAFDADGRLYVLEFGGGAGEDELYAGGSGRLLRIERDDTRAVILDRLNYPTAMAFSPSGDLYIALSGAFSAPGAGSILKVPCGLLQTQQACSNSGER